MKNFDSPGNVGVSVENDSEASLEFVGSVVEGNLDGELGLGQLSDDQGPDWWVRFAHFQLHLGAIRGDKIPKLELRKLSENGEIPCPMSSHAKTRMYGC